MFLIANDYDSQLDEMYSPEELNGLNVTYLAEQVQSRFVAHEGYNKTSPMWSVSLSPCYEISTGYFHEKKDLLL